MGKHSYDITGILNDLVVKKTLDVGGYGRGKVYYLNRDYKPILKEVNESSLSEDEIRILDYINENGSINNQQSRDNPAFGKDKNVILFNSLIKKRRIKQQYKVCVNLDPGSFIKKPTRSNENRSEKVKG